ncbi:aldose epimerase family protein [Sinorhizobium sp. BG8]|uniref:aldose epimerase family protein n=1 Tax=Sinorhizobium sp. BG8 TaxID=2613773 RepID=UPI00193CF074|nr:aldose epimerase family protein [Sinorhizobium sp. BG8]QRM53524.1 galactose mutarotase [Sinorhizobium sp. BG8]
MSAKAVNEAFGELATGETVYRIRLSGGGLTASVLTWGTVIQDLRLDGHQAPLVLGYENLSSYLSHSPYFGATPGRNSNRIGNGRFSIDGKTFQLELNEKGVTHLHGGSDGIAKRNWTVVEQAGDRVTLQITDPAGRAGYPGNCTVTCTYRLSDKGTLSVVYESVTDEATPCNICQHSYFNLDGRADALDHEIMIAADRYLPVDERQVPTGEVRSVDGTVFDLRKMTPMRRQTEGDRISYDHNFCLSAERQEKRLVARARSAVSGVSMDVRTTEPGIQFYTGFKINTPVHGLEGRSYGPYSGFCLETQVWPDAINHEGFPEAILRPGKVLRQETDYIFTKA